MGFYVGVIRSALLYFPLVAAVITLPFLLHHYRKFGSVTFLRFFLAYSFALYLLCAYCLVILPLPDWDEVAKLTGPSVQLIPFSFFRDLPKETDFVLTDPSTYLPALTSTFTLQFVFNFALLFPLGFYLRYYFRRKALFTGIASFCLSLFFELTQLSGLYGFYPRAYRLFDVDDLLCNTLGGLAGYLVTGWLWRVLPDRDRIDEKSYEKGERVTFPRRCFALLVDMLFVSLLYGLLSIFRLPFAFPVAYLLYFGLFQWACGGKSLGKRLTKFCVVNRDGSRVLLWRCLLRYALLELFCYAFWGVAWVFRQLPLDSSLVGAFLVAVWLFAGLCALLLEAAVNRSAGAQRDFLYGRLSGTRLKSTVQEKAAEGK